MGRQLFVADAVRAAGLGSVDLVLGRPMPRGHAAAEVDAVRVARLTSVDLVVGGTPRGRATPEVDTVRVARLESVDFVVRSGARLCAGFVGAGRHGVGTRPADCGGGEGDCSGEQEAWPRKHCGSPFVEPGWLGRSKATCVPVLPVERRPGTRAAAPAGSLDTFDIGRDRPSTPPIRICWGPRAARWHANPIRVRA